MPRDLASVRPTRAAWYRKRAVYRACFATAEGREVLGDLLRLAGANRCSFNPQAPDPALAMAFAEGRRSIGLHLTETLNLSHADIARLAQQEAEDGREDEGFGSAAAG